MNRRELLQTGVAVTASLPVIAQAAAWTPTPSTATSLAARTLNAHLSSLYKVIVDSRYAESRAFGRDATELGAAVHTIDGDITDVWYQDLYPRWRSKGAAGIAGLTAHGALFCLENLAWDFRMRVVVREHHAPPRAGFTPLISWVIALPA